MCVESGSSLDVSLSLLTFRIPLKSRVYYFFLFFFRINLQFLKVQLQLITTGTIISSFKNKSLMFL